jgi:glycosyltransferase involved in cell wall biosynthesis
MRDRLIIIYFGDYWETGRCRRRQQLALRLAQRPEVEKLLYIELPISLGELFKAVVGVGDHFAAARWRRVLRHGQRFSVGKIELITPICVVPFFRFVARPDTAFVHWQNTHLIRQALRESEADRLLLWVSHPFAAKHVGQFGESLLCYDCTEDFSSFLEWGVGVRWMARENDQTLTQQADLVLVQTPAHLGEKRRLNPHTYLVPNGADLERFASAEAITPAPVDIKGLPRPILGYVGTYNSRVDGRLLLKVAQNYPGGSLVLVGGVQRDADVEEAVALRNASNVHFLGEKPYDQVPGYLAHFGVCLIPFKVAQDNRRGSPLKLFDYLAAGRPVVSVALSGVEDFADMVYVAGDEHAFLKAIEAALGEAGSSLAIKRWERAQAHSWQAREEQVWGMLQEGLSRRGVNQGRVIHAGNR